MHCLLAVSFTCVCLQLAFICWKGPTTIKCCPFQQIKANRKQTRVKLTASKQCIRRSAFGVRRSAFGVRRSAFGVRRSAFGVRRSAFGVRRSAFGVRRSAFGVRRSAFGVRRSAFGVRRSAFGVRRSAFGVRRSAFGVRRSAFCVRRSAFGVLPLPSVMGNKPPKRKRSILVGVSDQSNQHKSHRQCKESFTETGSKYLWRSQSVGKRLRVYKVTNGLLVTASFSLIGGGGEVFYYKPSSISGQDKANLAVTGYPRGQDEAILPAVPLCPMPVFT